MLDLRTAVYAGKVVHPVFAELQAEGNVAFGVSQALFEEMVLGDVGVANPNLADYMIASLADMPLRLGVSLVEAPGGAGRIYGIGESALPTIPPAIANAVFDACGVRITSLPITPEKVLRGLRALRGDVHAPSEVAT